MPHIYVAPWSVYNEDGFVYYGPLVSVGHVGSLDLRSNTLCGRINAADPGYGLFVYDRPTVIAGGDYLGSDPQALLSLSQRNAIVNATGRLVVADNLVKVLRDQFLNPLKYDASGVNFHKPLRASRRGGVQLYLGEFGALIREAFDDNHPVLQATLDVRRADYRQARAFAETLPGGARTSYIEALRRNTGYDMLKLYGRMGSDLLVGLVPPEYQLDGWLVPATTIGDTFTDTNGVDILAHTATGPNGGFGWSETSNSWTIQGNALDVDADPQNEYIRANSDLASDDMYSQVKVSILSTSAGRNIGVLVRKDGTATDTYYYSDATDEGTGLYRTFKRVTGTFTRLDTDTNEGLAVNDIIKLDADGSSIKRYRNGVQVGSTFTDTAITGNLRAGIGGDEAGWRIDDFEAADLAAMAGFAHSQVVIIG